MKTGEETAPSPLDSCPSTGPAQPERGDDSTHCRRSKGLSPAGTHEHLRDARFASRRALSAAGLLLGAMFFAELAGGLLTGSLALLADAGHLLTDVGAVALALAAQWIGARPASRRKSYGFYRLEILAALVNGFTLWAIAAFIVREATLRLYAPPHVATGTMVAIAGVGMVVQTVVALVLARAAGESLNVKGAYVHAATDAIQSAGVVATGLVMMLTSYWLLDPLVSIAIAVLIAYSGGKIVWDATHILMEGTPEELDLPALLDAMAAEPGVRRVSDLHAWSITTGYNALSAHVETTSDLTPAHRERIRERLAARLLTEFPLHHLTLQVEVDCTMCGRGGCSEWLRTGTER